MRFAAFTMVVCLAAGCTGHLAQRAGKGAVRGGVEQLGELTPEQKETVGVQLAHNMTGAVLDELSLPDSKRKIADLVALATSRSVDTLAHTPLGGSPEWVQPNLPASTEPEGGSLDALAARAGRAAAQAALEELARHPDLAHNAGKEIARGAMEGAAQNLQLGTLVIGFVGGLVAASLVASLVRLIRPRRGGVEVHRHS